AIKKIPRLELIVAQKLEGGAVDRIGSRPAGGVDHGAIAAELDAVSVAEQLKLSDALHAKCGSESTRTGHVAPPAQEIFAVEQPNCVRRTRAGDRVFETIAGKGTAVRRGTLYDLSDARLQRDKLGVIASVQGQLAHLSAFHQCADCG